MSVKMNELHQVIDRYSKVTNISVLDSQLGMMKNYESTMFNHWTTILDDQLIIITLNPMFTHKW